MNSKKPSQERITHSSADQGSPRLAASVFYSWKRADEKRTEGPRGKSKGKERAKRVVVIAVFVYVYGTD